MLGKPAEVDRAESPVKAGNFRTPMRSRSATTTFACRRATLTMYSALERMNVPAKLLVWPDENHWITKAETVASSS